jgi:hypothetical protein
MKLRMKTERAGPDFYRSRPRVRPPPSVFRTQLGSEGGARSFQALQNARDLHRAPLATARCLVATIVQCGCDGSQARCAGRSQPRNDRAEI